jgi:hypothetical protein
MVTRIDKLQLARVLKEREEYLKRQAAADAARHARADIAECIDKKLPPPPPHDKLRIV